MKTNETKERLGKKGAEVKVHDDAQEPGTVAAQEPGTGAAQEPGTGAVPELGSRRFVDVRLKVYISGPISGYDYDERRRTFARWAAALWETGFEPVNPMENGVPEDAPGEAHMRADLKMLLECDSIMMLRGWERSLGARVEHEVALSCGLHVLKEPSKPALRDIYGFEW